MSLFKYCDLCNNSTSHQLVLKQVPCTALMITVLVLTLECCVLKRSANRRTKTLSHPWRPYKLTRSRSPCARKSWRVSVLASQVVSTELIPPLCTFSENSSVASENLSSQWWRIRVLLGASRTLSRLKKTTKSSFTPADFIPWAPTRKDRSSYVSTKISFVSLWSPWREFLRKVCRVIIWEAEDQPFPLPEIVHQK